MNKPYEPTRRDFVKTTSAAVLGASLASLKAPWALAEPVDTSKIINFNPDMDYRRCGKTGWMVSAVAMGGHWKRINQIIGGDAIDAYSGNVERPDFAKNRHDVVTRLIERGINYIDGRSTDEVHAYANALKGRRDKMYLGCSWYEREARFPQFRTAKALLATLDDGLKRCGLEYADLWRIICLTDGQQGPDGQWIYPHTEAESEQIALALEQAKKSGKIRAGGVSSHDRPWLEYMISTFPKAIEVVVCPYTSNTKALPQGSFFDTIKKFDCGFFGIKPFSSNAVFKGDSSPASPYLKEDNRTARLALRYILCNPVLTAPIPGLVSVEQVDNVALAVKERRTLDVKERAELEKVNRHAAVNLPADYQWLKNWDYV
jgi:aryl-alcohol dehydrogenase-like predicted oxidoreductase